MHTFMSMGSLLQKARTASATRLGLLLSSVATPTGTYAVARWRCSVTLPGYLEEISRSVVALGGRDTGYREGDARCWRVSSNSLANTRCWWCQGPSNTGLPSSLITDKKLNSSLAVQPQMDELLLSGSCPWTHIGVRDVFRSIQVFLAIKFFPTDDDGEENAQEHRDLSGRGLNIEVCCVLQMLVQHSRSINEVLLTFQIINEDPNGGVSSRRFKENYLVGDDEDSPSNSNAVNGLYNRHKVPPDKTDLDGRISQGDKVPHRNGTSLRLEELDFVPACDIVTKEAISAIHRAKTQRCKRELVNITCLIQRGRLYPKQLTSSCPSQGLTAGKSLGCYEDKKTFRMLTGYFANLKLTNSPKHCMNMCLQSGFQYAGVQYSALLIPGKPAGVPKESAEPGEPRARIAFLLTLNGRALRQVRRLIRVLFHKDHFFFIHVDARQDYLYRELLLLEKTLPNVRLARQRFATIWGGSSLLQMLLTSMGELLNLGWSWDFIINLSESDFPIKTNNQLGEFLTANKGRNFVKSHGREVQRFVQKQGLDKTFVECDAHMWRTGDRRLPWGVQMDGGSDWVALSRPFVTYLAGVNGTRDLLLQGLITVFRYTLLPAESFFHTLLRNSQFCTTYVDNNLHVTNWKRRLGCRCQYKHVVDWCGCSPNDFKMEDWPRLQGTEGRQLFFARKFEPIVNQAVIHQLEERLYGLYPPGVPNVASYWQSVYHHADLSPPPDDSLVTLTHSLLRLASKLLSSDACSVTPSRLIEVTSYHHQDSYKGSLILYEVSVGGSSDVVILETWVRPQQFLGGLKMNGPVKMLKTLYVSSDYDQKEQVSRNNLQSLGPFSEPVLVFQLSEGPAGAAVPSLNLTVLWVDPAGQLAEVSEVHVEDASTVNHVKPSLREPLLPGVWEVKMVLNSSLVARTQFLVIPLQLVSGVDISQHQSTFLHNGPAQSFVAPEGVDYERFMASAGEKLALRRKATANSKRFGVDLQKWIDSLTNGFYKVVESCAASTRQTSLCGGVILEPCEGTVWSSLAPDPKSQICTVNNITGRMDRLLAVSSWS
uniref:protein xylosyltransferase n=1 Tax=Timema cristinae TaxID=61476 RepID=A0A7R9GT59_TIMCR|nr:unnamed protein product [Timema cristinae]